MPSASTKSGFASENASNQGGFTIVELMIVVAIVSILAVIAMPAYQNYTVRSKVSEALTFAAEAKTTVAERYSTTNTMPTSNLEAGLSAADSYDAFNYIKSLELSSTPAPGTIVITIKMPGSSANDKQLHLVPSTANMPIVWTCEPVDGPTGISTTHVPPNCRG